MRTVFWFWISRSSAPSFLRRPFFSTTTEERVHDESCEITQRLCRPSRLSACFVSKPSRASRVAFILFFFGTSDTLETLMPYVSRPTVREKIMSATIWGESVAAGISRKKKPILTHPPRHAISSFSLHDASRESSTHAFPNPMTSKNILLPVSTAESSAHESSCDD